MLTTIFLVVLYLAPVIGIALFLTLIGAAGYLGYLELRGWLRGARAQTQTSAEFSVS